MKFKKLTTLLIALSMTAALAACGSAEEDNSAMGSQTGTQIAMESETESQNIQETETTEEADVPEDTETTKETETPADSELPEDTETEENTEQEKPQQEIKPVEDKEPESTPAEDKKPETKPAEDKKPETKPAEDKKPETTTPSEDKKPETKPSEDKKPETKPSEDKKPETKPSEDKKPEVKPEEEAPSMSAPAKPPVEEEAPQQSAKDSTGILSSIWATYTKDEEKFPAAGGDPNNTNMEGAGKVDPSDKDYMEFALAVPADACAYVDDAASLMHMMNANTFTGGAFHITDAKNTDAFIAAVKDSVLNRQWMCGFPQRLFIIKLDSNNVIMAFGENTIMDTFKKHVTETYANATFVVNQNLDI